MRKHVLNYDWSFVDGKEESYLSAFPSDAERIDIPHCPRVVQEDYFSEEDYQGVFSYEKIFDFDKKGDTKVYLCFDGVMLKLHCYLNGEDLGEQISGYLPVRYDVSSLLKEKDNRLVVFVDSKEDPLVPPFGNVVDYLTFSGIYREVYLLSYPSTYLDDVMIVKADHKGTLIVEPTIEGNKDAEVIYRLYDNKDKLVLESKEKEMQVKNVHPWDICDPYLYTLKVTLNDNGVEDEKSIRFGFRTYAFDSHGFYLNGKKVKLIGMNRHQNYPFVGPSLPRSAQEDDARIIKEELGCNIVRTSHYTQGEDFLSYCDEIGLLVQTEVPGWQYLSKDEKWRSTFLDFIERMVKKERNHTSIISYGVRVDESEDDDDLYQKANDICHKLDPNRATTGVRNFKDSHCLEDYYSYNDFSCADIHHGLDDPKTIKGAKGKAILVSENNGHMFPTKSYDISERRIESAFRHLRVINDAYMYDDYIGEIGWCAFDYNTHKDFGSGDHICYHGVCDIYRNLKASGYAYQSQNPKETMLYIANIPISGDNDEANIKPLVVFTDCDSIKFYRNGEYIKTFYPDRKNYPYLKHPPIILDDYIGELFKENLSKKDTKTMVNTLNYIGKVGLAHINPIKLLPALMISVFKKIPISQITAWYFKYQATWGNKSSVYTLDGYKGDKKVISKNIAAFTTFDYLVKPQKTTLKNADTYDCSRISVYHVDENENQLTYSFSPIRITTDGPIKLLSPSLLSLKGGDVSFYVRSLPVKEPTKATVTIETDRGNKTIDFIVE